MAVDANGRIQIATSHRPRMIAVEFLLELRRVTGLALLAAFYLKVTVIVRSNLRMWVLFNTTVACRAVESAVNGSAQFGSIYGQRQYFATG